MDLFVFIQKLDADGELCAQFNVPNRGEPVATLTETVSAMLKYKGGRREALTLQ